jgi:hypothetical protein
VRMSTLTARGRSAFAARSVRGSRSRSGCGRGRGSILMSGWRGGGRGLRLLLFL